MIITQALYLLERLQINNKSNKSYNNFMLLKLLHSPSSLQARQNGDVQDTKKKKNNIKNNIETT